MDGVITRWISLFEAGRMGRRELIGRLGAMMGTLAGFGGLASAQEPERPKSTFNAKGLNHIALRVTDLARSKKFYQTHLGMTVVRESESSAFLNCGEQHFVALFRGSQAGMDHYCYSIDDYDQKAAAKKLRAVGIEPELHGNRIYFDDPDGLQVQLAGPRHWPVPRKDD